MYLLQFDQMCIFTYYSLLISKSIQNPLICILSSVGFWMFARFAFSGSHVLNRPLRMMLEQFGYSDLIRDHFMCPQKILRNSLQILGNGLGI